MKRAIFAILSVFICLALFSACSSGEKSIANDAKALVKINAELVFPFSQRGEPAADCTNTEKPAETIADVKFELVEAGGKTVYSPRKEVDADTFERVIAALQEEYGVPSHQLGSQYLWVSESGDFELTAVYSTKIHHNMAIGVK